MLILPATQGFVLQDARGIRERGVFNAHFQSIPTKTSKRRPFVSPPASTSRRSLATLLLSASSSSSSSWQEDIQQAIQVSKLGQSNIDAAHQACDQWESILSNGSKNNDQGTSTTQLQLPSAVHTLCLALYASCLVRTGRDDQAVVTYEKALSLLSNPKDPAVHDLLLGKAKAHQRLLQYSEALDDYATLVELTKDGTISMDLSHFVGAATCSMRLQYPQRAQVILSTACDWWEKEQDTIVGSDERARLQRDWAQIRLFLHVLDHCFGTEKSAGNQSSIRATGQWILSAISSSRNEHPLYVWLHDTTLYKSMDPNMAPLGPQFADKSPKRKSIESTNDVFLSAMKINQSPWDDPSLLQLDDKVLLHRLLSSNSAASTFWPHGYVLPTDRKKFQQANQLDLVPADQKWISKTRAGYGSHGNQILNFEEALKNVESNNEKISQDEFLMQRLIDPTLLIEGRKFSLRLYVVYFGPKEFYLSNQGLVKLAAIGTTEEGIGQGDDSERRSYMTNSGREQNMEQYDLLYLEHESKLFGTEAEYSSFWSKIEDSVQQVMKSYRAYRRDNEREITIDFDSRRQALGIPKILGLDYVVDKEYQPWLLEVNRFPGLEPRDDSDRMVKHQIVRDAWLCAHERMSGNKDEETQSFTTGDHHPLQYILDHLPLVSKDCPYTLEKIR
ncbi:unnamed protein product [Cylindrotheca closterium]|uniref:Tubulin--tyrosine ligase-like protein 5 n=1 Tax=Cylindrotheca closterium TaxID=2856 RepID=A0AAD2CU25_9STRA|nr:unnamed protein product [Cylindrotheca closterium]